ncbi:hypothetical protein Hanom_Chr05g00454951 [Helianthus anomalus]
MAIKVKPQRPRFKKFEIWTKMAKVPKQQGPKWQFTLIGNKTSYVLVDEDDNDDEFRLLSYHELDAFNTQMP